RFDPITTLAAVATQTSHVGLGTAILMGPIHTPVLLAQRLATLDCLCEGRLTIGIGLGADTPGARREYATAGIPYDQRLGRLIQTV
ncbi:MAG TPA: LLM class flavin-dependent oxidoreductase, partial [Alphaproteobacteria bacterium]|nr:LLM class flavin-dependent oxidoreductase [Alphaproteobacteria bacterium]